MKTITFHCEVITPMFIAGADGKTPELRPPSIKGAMRFWWRAVNGHLPLAELKKKEMKIFGNQEKRSKVEVVVEYNQKLLKDKFVKNTRLVSHKSFTAPAIQAGYKFTVTLLSNDVEKLKTAANIFILLSFLGGLGKRSRRGRGAFNIYDISNKNIEFIDRITYDINTLELILKNLSSNAERVKDGFLFKYEGKLAQYPYLERIYISNEENENYKTIFGLIDQTAHKFSEKQFNEYQASLGGRRFRFASPVIIQANKINPYYINISKLATFPPYKYRTNINLKLQQNFIEQLIDINDTNIEVTKKKIDDKTEIIPNEIDISKELKNYKLRLKRLEIDKFRGISEFKADIDKDITVFIGDNGFGKTSVVDALAKILKNFYSEYITSKLKNDNLIKLEDINVNSASGYISIELDIVCNFNFDENETEKLEQELEKNYFTDLKNDKDELKAVLPITYTLRFNKKEEENKTPEVVFKSECDKEGIIKKLKLTDFDTFLFSYYGAKIDDKNDKNKNENDTKIENLLKNIFDANKFDFINFCNSLRDSNINFTSVKATKKIKDILISLLKNENIGGKYNVEFTNDKIYFIKKDNKNAKVNQEEKDLILTSAFETSRYNIDVFYYWLINKYIKENVIKNREKTINEILKKVSEKNDADIRYSLEVTNDKIYLTKYKEKEKSSYSSTKSNIDIFCNWLRNKKIRDIAILNKLKKIREVLKETLETENSEVEYNVKFKNNQIYFIKKTGDKKTEIEYTQLSAGEKNISSIVIDLTMRLAEAYEPEQSDYYRSYDKLLEQEGIVLIDELDLHLHPKWQREILPKLRSLFPNIQFIITTHSPFIVQDVELNNLFLLGRNKENIKSLGEYFKGWQIEDLLADLFDVSVSLAEEIQNKIKNFYEYIDKEDYYNANRLYHEIIPKLHKESNLSKLLKLQINWIND